MSNGVLDAHCARVGRDPADITPTAVHALECESLDSGGDIEHGVLIKWDEVGVAPNSAILGD